MKHIRSISAPIYLNALLILWFSIIFFDVPLLTIDGHASLISVYGLLALLLLVILAGLVLHWKNIHYFTLVILGLWGYLQFNSNWKYLFVETSQENIQAYYLHFDNTLRFFPESDTKIIPDAYHIILGILLLINIVITIRILIKRIIEQSLVKRRIE
jgi:hypothetical protein